MASSGLPRLDISGLTADKLKRLLAFAIDLMAVLALAYAAYYFIKAPDFFAVKQTLDSMNALQPGSAELQQAGALMTRQYAAAQFYTLVIWFLYEFIAMIITGGSTVGKMIFGLKVVSMKEADGRIKTVLRLAFRTLIKWLFVTVFWGFPFLISCLTIFANKENRTGFDILAGTRVAHRAGGGRKAQDQRQ